MSTAIENLPLPFVEHVETEDKVGQHSETSRDFFIPALQILQHEAYPTFPGVPELSMSVDDCVDINIVEPEPINGIRWFIDHPDGTSTLNWAEIQAQFADPNGILHDGSGEFFLGALPSLYVENKADKEASDQELTPNLVPSFPTHHQTSNMIFNTAVKSQESELVNNAGGDSSASNRNHSHMGD